MRPPSRASLSVEVGWRLARAHWGNGYATEAARAAVAYGFDHPSIPDGPLRRHVLYRLAPSSL